MTTTKEIGNKGEELAVEYLIKHNYQILEKNWRHKHLEVDIIAKKESILCIIEVKYRSYNTYGEPEVFVNKQKQKFLIEAANQYINKYNLNEEVRFDIISITKSQNGFSVKHIEDAFYAQ